MAALHPDLHALDPDKSVFQFNIQNWTRQNGLPADKTNTITQSRDGYLWLGSQHGLVRFDGLEFKTVPIDLPEAQGQEVIEIESADDGRVWFAISGGGYGSYDGHKFSPIADRRWTVPGTNANTILATPDGAIWTGSVIGWGRWVGGKPQDTFINQSFGSVVALGNDPSGRVWLGTAEHGLYHWEKGGLTLFPDDELKHRNIYAITQDPAGDLWVATSAGIYRYDSAFHRKDIYLPAMQTNALLVDRHGMLWAGTKGAGLVRFKDGGFVQLRKADGLGSDNITSLFEDTEGSLWVGTLEGLSQLSDLKFPIYSSKEGLLTGPAVAVAASPRGGLWIGLSGGTSYFDGHTATNYSDPSILPNQYTRRVFEARNGEVYLGDGSRNICVLSAGRLVTRFTVDQWPEAFAEDASSVLVGIGSDLFRFREGRLEPYRFAGKTSVFGWFNSLCVARDGAIWAGTNGGLFRIKDGQTKGWFTTDGLSSDRVHFVFEDIDGSIWCGLPTGLVRIKDNHVATVTPGDGLADGRIFAMVPDDHGSFWLYSGRGILRVARQSLTDFVEGRARRIECAIFDGLESVKFSDRSEQGYGGCKTLDGRIWFPGPAGVVMIDPVRYFTNRVPPRVYVGKIRVKGRDLPNQRSLTLPVGDRSVEFFFTALSYIAPKKIHLQYQLTGFDPAWIDAGAHRSVVYSNLPAGRYNFRVRAANADGVWNTAGDAFSLELPPAYYERPWFFALIAGVLALAVFGGYRWKVRLLRQRQKKLQAENELLEAKVARRTDELAHSLAMLKATLDSTADGILAIQLSDRAISYNRQFAEMWRIPPESVDRINAAELRAFTATLTKDPVQFTALIERLLTQPEAEMFDVIALKDGRTFERYSKPQYVGGKIVGAVVNYRDITERQRAEEKLTETSALLETFLRNSPDLIYFKDLASRFVRVSHAMPRRFGLTDPAMMLGKTDADFFSPEHAQVAYADEQEIIRTGQPVVGKLEKETYPDGRVTWALTTKIPWPGRDGKIIGTFGISKDITALKETEAKLEQMHRQLLTTSRQAGMAEVAAGVLHNVGNTLNSVNVSATLVAEQVGKSRLSRLAKVCELLRDHAADLGAFLQEDPKGRHLTAYLEALASQFAAEHATMLREIDSLRKNVDHIKDIIAMQQNYARISGVVETVPVIDLVEDALRMNASALAEHNIALVRDYQTQPTVVVEQHKVLQILVNLIRNAKHACDESDRPGKQISVRTTSDDRSARIAITDNGVGIPAENLMRIFNHGFTTRKDGHGFGLHSGALAARELGGSLTVQSDGAGHGATFILELPCKPVTPAQEDSAG